jgi:hypothetical protein
MPDRDWDKELAKVDKQLASLSDDKLITPPAASGKETGKRAPAPAAGGKPAPRDPASGPKETTSFGVYARLTISVLLGVGMTMWPYPSRCGPGLAAYLAAVIVVITSGVWSSVWTWRHRASHAHMLSLLLILWGLVLGSMEVLPRVGYAKADLGHPAAWSCPAS